VESFTFIVMEHGSEWPAQVARDASDCVVLRQEACEPPDMLLRRTHQRLATIARHGGSVRVAVLTCSGESSRGAFEGRVPLARALATAVTSGRESRLLIVGHSQSRERVGQSLLGLVEVVVGSCSTTVTAVFPLARSLPEGASFAA
jgi:hypothetical protein